MKLFSQLVMTIIYNMGNSHAVAVSHYIWLLSPQTWLNFGSCLIWVWLWKCGSRSKHLRLKVIRNVWLFKRVSKYLCYHLLAFYDHLQAYWMKYCKKWWLSALSYLLFVKITKNWDGSSIIKRLYQVFGGRFRSVCYRVNVQGAWFSNSHFGNHTQIGQDQKIGY